LITLKKRSKVNTMSTLCLRLRKFRFLLREIQKTLAELGKTLRKLNPLLHTLEDLLIRVALAVLVAYHLWSLWHR
jgi:hypothetical protein